MKYIVNFYSLSRLINVVAFGLVFTNLTHAQKTGESSKVVVTGKKTSLSLENISQNIQTIEKKEIRNSPASTIEELLSYYSGIDIRQRGAHGIQADISIRGSSFEQVLVLINGIPMNDSQTAHNMLSLPLDLASVQKIEIVKGPAARRFGLNAYAGVVNIITQPSTENKLGISMSGGDYGTYSLSANANLNDEKFSQFIQIGNAQSDGYRYNTDFTKKNIWYQNRYTLDKGELWFQSGFFEKKFGANGFYSSPQAKEQYEEIQTSLVSLGWTQQFSNIKLQSHVFWRRSQDEYIFNRKNPSAYRNLHLGNTIGAKAEASYLYSLGIAKVGADVRREFINSTNLGDKNRTISLFFLEQRFLLFNNALDISPGISFVNYSDQGNFWYPGIDMGYKINSKNKIFLNVGKTYRIPSYTDLFYTDPLNNGNPDLKPEMAWSYEIGYQANLNKLSSEISLFRREANNLIDWVKENEDSKWTPENIARVNTNGVEVKLNYDFGYRFFSSINIGYTYLDNKLENKTANFSKYLLDNLKHQLVVKLEQKLFKNWTNQWIYRYNDRLTLDNYQLLDARLSFKNRRLESYLQVNNILNTQYTETNLVPMPGRWLEVGLTFNIFFINNK